MKRVAWLLGWAVPERWFAEIVRAEWPEAEHVAVAASCHAWGQLEARGPYDAVIGYSLGALLLLRESERTSRLAARVALLAPIFAFPKESEAGGRIGLTQLRFLRRWLQREPAAAVADFYLRAGLPVPAGAAAEFCCDELKWGLDRLERDEVPPRLPSGWSAWCGDADALLDATRLAQLEPAVRVVAGATHAPVELIRAAREELR